MDGTRVDIISDIVSRLTNPDPDQRVVILSGSAGSGKSTIAKSVASILAEQKKVLAASFFFAWDTAERNHIKPLPTTLARQLADHDDCFRRFLVKLIVEDRTGILDMDPHLQFQKLVVELLGQAPPTQTPWVICLDALDECGKDRGVLCLRWLSDNMNKIPKNIRFFLTGRPNVPQYLQFDKLHSLVHEIILDDVDTSQVRQDIHLYVEKSLDGGTWDVRDSWKACPQDVKQITAHADGLFVFAATAVRYICSAVPQVHPQDSINFLLGGDPLTDIHDLYYRVLDEAIVVPDSKSLRAQNYFAHIKRILGTIVLLLKPQSPEALAKFLGMDVEDLRRTLHPLSAVIQIPREGGTIKIIHLSFREFLMSTIQERRLDLLCGTENQKEEMASGILQIMETGLKFNICDLPTSYLKNVDMPNITQSIQAGIPEHLQYACQFWADHVTAIPYNHEHAQATENFLLKKFLFWLEALSLLGIVGSASHALSKFIWWAPEVRKIIG
jgi:energy-coupling factor transporter ATP-binding protein EcfA2